MFVYTCVWPSLRSGILVIDWFMVPPERCGVLWLNWERFLWQSSASPHVCSLLSVFLCMYLWFLASWSIVAFNVDGRSRHGSGDSLPSCLRYWVPPSFSSSLGVFSIGMLCIHPDVWRDVKMCYRDSINSCPAPMFFAALVCSGPGTTVLLTNSNITSDSTSSW